MPSAVATGFASQFTALLRRKECFILIVGVVVSVAVVGSFSGGAFGAPCSFSAGHAVGT
jgi:hypothetical protein